MACYLAKKKKKWHVSSFMEQDLDSNSTLPDVLNKNKKVKIIIYT